MKYALITGGSRGIGAAAVRAFCRAGYETTFFYEKDKRAAATVSVATGARGICCDVADADAVKAAISRLPRVDVLVNNAAVSHIGTIRDISGEDWDRLFAVNVKGVYHCVNAVLPGMLEAQSGCILNVASMWGEVGASCEVCYSAAKGAVISMTKALAKELAPSGIRVNAVSPGVIDTDMNAHLTEDDKNALCEETPLGRIGKPEEVAQALLYLAEAEFVTGQILSVNGGFVI